MLTELFLCGDVTSRADTEVGSGHSSGGSGAGAMGRRLTSIGQSSYGTAQSGGWRPWSGRWRARPHLSGETGPEGARVCELYWHWEMHIQSLLWGVVSDHLELVKQRRARWGMVQVETRVQE